MKPSQNSLFKADAYVRAVAGVEFWDWFRQRHYNVDYTLYIQKSLESSLKTQGFDRVPLPANVETKPSIQQTQASLTLSDKSNAG
jgi:hypothetical protein